MDKQFFTCAGYKPLVLMNYKFSNNRFMNYFHYYYGETLFFDNNLIFTFWALKKAISSDIINYIKTFIGEEETSHIHDYKFNIHLSLSNLTWQRTYNEIKNYIFPIEHLKVILIKRYKIVTVFNSIFCYNCGKYSNDYVDFSHFLKYYDCLKYDRLTCMCNKLEQDEKDATFKYYGYAELENQRTEITEHDEIEIYEKFNRDYERVSCL